MKTVYLFPPMWREINDAFNVRGKPVIFTFGETIFNPGRIKVSPELVAHEEVHQRRQGDDPSSWWHRYIADREFRFAEELPAHCAEFAHVSQRLDGRPLQRALHRIAVRLSSPLYGDLIGYDEAKSIILNAQEGTARHPL